MSKTELIAEFIEKLRAQVEIMKKALADSSENATGEQTKSEGKYDTRAIEASYLAEAQRQQLNAAQADLGKLENFSPPDFPPESAISLGSLVETELEGEIFFYLLAPAGGGLNTTYLGCETTLITPDSRLFQQLLDQKIGPLSENSDLIVLDSL
jgi:hypothetical protein